MFSKRERILPNVVNGLIAQNTIGVAEMSLKILLYLMPRRKLWKSQTRKNSTSSSMPTKNNWMSFTKKNKS